jgi:uncharacterized protein YbaR (Trm112 family)/SAM-dependent methyltransferase
MRVPLEILACPKCASPLETSGEGLRCAACGGAYPVISGVPLLMTPEDRARFGVRLAEPGGAGMAARYSERASASLGARLKRILRPPLPLVHNPAEPALPCPPGSLNLHLGGGGRSVPGFFNLDIGLFPGVDVVANAERLPFAEEALDAIECDAVLEHVEAPESLAREALRVLKPGGLFHAVVPFCHPYHAYPADYRRWTQAGLGHWLAGLGFEILATGARTGPTATLLTFLLEYVKLLFGGGSAGKAAYAAAGWLLFPFRYLDCWLNRRAGADLLANHVFALARKPEGSRQ